MRIWPLTLACFGRALADRRSKSNWVAGFRCISVGVQKQSVRTEEPCRNEGRAMGSAVPVTGNPMLADAP